MKCLSRGWLVPAALVLACFQPGPASAADTPQAVVNKVYGLWLKKVEPPPSLAAQTALVGRYLTPEFKAAFAHASKFNTLDEDPFTRNQESAVSAHALPPQGNDVTVQLKSGMAPPYATVTVHVRVKLVGGVWLVDDVLNQQQQDSAKKEMLGPSPFR